MDAYIFIFLPIQHTVLDTERVSLRSTDLAHVEPKVTDPYPTMSGTNIMSPSLGLLAMAHLGHPLSFTNLDS